MNISHLNFANASKFLLKWANRQIAYFNESQVDRLLSLPSSVCNSLNHWIKSARKTLCLQNSNNNKFADYFDVLFVDASTWGWGAYFISSSGESSFMNLALKEIYF